MDDALLLSPDVYTDQPLHDARAIHDMISLRFDELQKDREGTWLVAKITPAPHSGSATVIGAYIEGESGRLIDQSTGNVVPSGGGTIGMIEEGSWELIDTLSHFTGANRAQYGWTEPLDPTERRLEAKDLYSPLAKGGVALCRYRPGAQGAAQFAPVYLIPPGWEAAIRPAYEAFKQSSQLFTAPSSPAHYARFLGMLLGNNSVVSVMAFRTLAENRKIDTPSLRDALGRSEGYRQAAFVYLLMLEPGQIGESGLLSELTAVIGAIGTPEGHRPIALGIVAARLLHPGLHTSQSLGPKVLTAVSDRSARLAAKTAADPYLRRLLEITGFTRN